MPSLAAMILWASREAARALRSAASAASRYAAAPRSGSGGAPASDPVRPPIAAPPSGSSLADGSGSPTTPPPPVLYPITAPPLWNNPAYANRSTFDKFDELALRKKEGRVEFVAEEKDLESDEALWALYERWCKAFNQQRDRDEMVERFPIFKKMMVLSVQQTHNKAGLTSNKYRLNEFTDGNCPPGVPMLKYLRRLPHAEPGTVIYGKAPDFLFTEELERRK